jgi:hypothetical protein
MPTSEFKFAKKAMKSTSQENARANRGIVASRPQLGISRVHLYELIDKYEILIKI